MIGHQGSVKGDGELEASTAQIPTLTRQPPGGLVLTQSHHPSPTSSTNGRPTLIMSEMPLSLRLSTKVSRG